MKASKKYLGRESYIVDLEFFSEKREEHWIRLSIHKDNFYYTRYFWKETEDPETKKSKEVQSFFNEILEDCVGGIEEAHRIKEILKTSAQYLPKKIKNKIFQINLPEKSNPFIESVFTFDDFDQFQYFD
jgi:hypothetical protein